MNIKEALEAGRKKLEEAREYQAANPESHTLKSDCEALLCFCLNETPAFLKTWPEKKLEEKQLEYFFTLINKRSNNYPLAYIMGEQEFWSLSFDVNEDVLIPRPETECLVEFLLNHFNDNHEKLTGLDLGTGSGAIAISLAKEKPDWQITACDISKNALACAKKNALKNQTINTMFLQSNWFENIPEQNFGFIISNPPYVEDSAKELAYESIKFEPQLALTSGNDGLDAIRTICQQAGSFLKVKAPLIIEHSYQQAEAVKNIFEEAQFFQVKCYKDYAQLDRFTVGFKS
jgi:release factor glutamine methyltransferase